MSKLKRSTMDTVSLDYTAHLGACGVWVGSNTIVTFTVDPFGRVGMASGSKRNFDCLGKGVKQTVWPMVKTIVSLNRRLCVKADYAKLSDVELKNYLASLATGKFRTVPYRIIQHQARVRGVPMTERAHIVRCGMRPGKGGVVSFWAGRNRVIILERSEGARKFYILPQRIQRFMQKEADRLMHISWQMAAADEKFLIPEGERCTQLSLPFGDPPFSLLT